MRFSFVKWLGISAGLGIVVSILLLGLAHAAAAWGGMSSAGYWTNRTMRILWPSSVWLMATEGIESSAQGYLFLLISILTNGLTYAVLGTTCWWIHRAIKLKR
jgi:hypothetical protein